MIAKSFPIHYLTKTDTPSIQINNDGNGPKPCEHCGGLNFEPIEIWFNANGDNLNNTLSLAVDCIICTQSAMVHYNTTEDLDFLDMCWDYNYIRVKNNVENTIIGPFGGNNDIEATLERIKLGEFFDKPIPANEITLITRFQMNHHLTQQTVDEFIDTTNNLTIRPFLDDHDQPSNEITITTNQ